MNSISAGIYPVMLTPYTDNMDVDYLALECLIDWYLNSGCDGLFSVCQSSEMIYLTSQERKAITQFVVEKVNGRVPVVASGHVEESVDDQIRDLKTMMECGVDCVVLVTNRLACQFENENIVKQNITNILNTIPEIDFGLYECPYPYKRLFSPDLLKWCAETGRFTFYKETSCDIDSIKAKLKAIVGSRIKLFNANTATLYEALTLGCHGFSGIMANFHPKLYQWFYNNKESCPKKAEQLFRYLKNASSETENNMYSLNAKYYLQCEGIPLKINSRNPSVQPLSKSEMDKMEIFHVSDKKMLEFLLEYLC